MRILVSVRSYSQQYVQCWMWYLAFHTNTLWANWRLRCWIQPIECINLKSWVLSCTWSFVIVIGADWSMDFALDNPVYIHLMRESSSLLFTTICSVLNVKSHLSYQRTLNQLELLEREAPQAPGSWCAAGRVCAVLLGFNPPTPAMRCIGKCLRQDEVQLLTSCLEIGIPLI